MTKYLVTFYNRGMKEKIASIEVYAEDYDHLYSFIDRFYTDTSWDYDKC